MVYLTIKTETTQELEIESARNLIKSIMQRYNFPTVQKEKKIQLSINAYFDSIEWSIFIVHEDDSSTLKEIVHTHYPRSTVTIMEPTLPTFPCYLQTAIVYQPKSIDKAASLFKNPITISIDNDPLIAITNKMKNLHKGDVVKYVLDISNCNFDNELIEGTISFHFFTQKVARLPQLLTVLDKFQHLSSKLAIAVDPQEYVEDKYAYWVRDVFVDLNKLTPNEYPNSRFVLTYDEVVSMWHLL